MIIFLWIKSNGKAQFVGRIFPEFIKCNFPNEWSTFEEDTY